MQIIPVLDLQAGQAVRAVAGDRNHYRPLTSVLHKGSDPWELARAIRDQLGARSLYLADLDAIGGAPPTIDLYQQLAALGLSLWVDAGLRGPEGLPPLIEAGIATVVAGLETLDGPAALSAIVQTIGSGRIVFSLDLREGRPLVDTSANWGSSDPAAIAAIAIACGIRRVLLLDLSRVGTGRGTGTSALLRFLRRNYGPNLELTVGGGIAGPLDLAESAAAGASTALVGSALHDGRLQRPHLQVLLENRATTDPGSRIFQGHPRSMAHDRYD